MKLFAREHLPLLFWSALQWAVVLLVYRLDGFARPSTALYAVFLSAVLLSCYLLIRYFTHRGFYARLTERLGSLGQSVARRETAPLPSALGRLLDAQYSHYRNEIQAWERKQREHLTFINQWAHQMKTPLSVIEMITQDEEDERLRSISEEGDRMRHGIEMMLYTARLETFEQDFGVEPVSLRQTANEAVHEYKRLFIRSHVYPEVNVDERFVVQTDAKWLRFIVLQLLSNAIKYSSGSGRTVTVSAFERDGAPVLEIRDRGVGIPKADRQRVFQPFYTGENGRSFKESTGMGLYLANEVAKKLELRLELESEVGAGTAVRIAFGRRLTTL
ncbi:HAMP domain-containing histidine kinase [Paenibacillus sp. MWE-103]|uniref:histidine kinase n=1 Tax=Paenibacillus artemisiicola TaxID=1172618 RepID=A0ABS3W4U4_9BACL|nr:HAMP domain-containing sensor histidine kinase [Paenibacillus artemisiicola]MBO7743323.1 HAMP domain-containing histidine kinase [Paenibacillus artemisiicola]